MLKESLSALESAGERPSLERHPTSCIVIGSRFGEAGRIKARALRTALELLGDGLAARDVEVACDLN